MKILFLAPHPFLRPRGTPIAERAVLAALAAEGHEVDVLTYAEGDDPGIPGCRIHRIRALPGTRDIRPGFSLKKLVCDAVMLPRFLALARRGRYDLVHAVEESAFMALLGRWLLGVPYIYDMDSGLAEQMTERFRWLRPVAPALEAFERRALRGSVGVLAVCKDLETRARREAPAAVVGCVEDVSLLGDAPPPAVAPLASGDGPLALYVGNLEPYQGVDLLLEAFALAAPQVPEARLAVVGGPPEVAAALARRSAARGLGDRVHFTGPRPIAELGSLLAQATVLVSPRISGSNTPMKLYSYMDSGRPVLATRLATHTQVLDDETALLVEPEPAAFAEGLVRLLGDTVLRTRLAANARALARREHTPEAARRKLLRFYAEVEARLRPVVEEVREHEYPSARRG